jgi:hypothetical protein
MGLFGDQTTADAVPTDGRLNNLLAWVKERLAQHRENLRLWENGFLTPTEPDPQERGCVVRELKAAIAELEALKESCS